MDQGTVQIRGRGRKGYRGSVIGPWYAMNRAQCKGDNPFDNTWKVDREYANPLSRQIMDLAKAVKQRRLAG